MRKHVNSNEVPEVLFHKDLGFPHHINLPTFGYCLQYGSHARKEALEDRYGSIELPKFVRLYEADIVEIGVQCGTRLSKVVARQKHCNNFDIVIVFNPADGFVRTVWLNHKNDSHKTLDETKYKKVLH